MQTTNAAMEDQSQQEATCLHGITMRTNYRQQGTFHRIT